VMTFVFSGIDVMDSTVFKCVGHTFMQWLNFRNRSMTCRSVSSHT